MALDYSVVFDCDPKRHFGSGDCNKGAADILERLKAKSRAAAIAETARRHGQDPSVIKITLRVPDRNGEPIEREVSLSELQVEAKPLDDHSSPCASCPANFLDKPYGCFGVINYPVPAVAENWLIGRLQPAGTFGAELCLRAMSDFSVTGTTVLQMREAGFFENTKAQKVTFKKSFLKSTSITADQLLDAIFAAGDALNPAHCFGILVWLGAIKIDGKVPGTLDDQGPIRVLANLKTREDKQRHAQLELGPPGSGTEPFRNLVRALYLSWMFDVPLSISA